MDFNDSSHHFYPHLCSILHSFGLTQVASGYTQTAPSGRTSLTYLTLVPSSNVRQCSTIPHLANSDHLGLHLQLDLQPTQLLPEPGQSGATPRPTSVYLSNSCQKLTGRNSSLVTLILVGPTGGEYFYRLWNNAYPIKYFPLRRRQNLGIGIVQSMR